MPNGTRCCPPSSLAQLSTDSRFGGRPRCKVARTWRQRVTARCNAPGSSRCKHEVINTHTLTNLLDAREPLHIARHRALSDARTSPPDASIFVDCAREDSHAYIYTHTRLVKGAGSQTINLNPNHKPNDSSTPLSLLPLPALPSSTCAPPPPPPPPPPLSSFSSSNYPSSSHLHNTLRSMCLVLQYLLQSCSRVVNGKKLYNNNITRNIVK